MQYLLHGLTKTSWLFIGNIPKLKFHQYCRDPNYLYVNYAYKTKTHIYSTETGSSLSLVVYLIGVTTRSMLMQTNH